MCSTRIEAAEQLLKYRDEGLKTSR